MLTATIKIADIVARSLFLLIVLYALPVRTSGQFGIGLTLIALFAFVCGYERYLDLQRQLAGRSEREVDGLIASTLKFFFLGYLAWIVPLVLALRLAAHLGPLEIALWVVIAIGEHLSNEAYRVALISMRHRSILWMGLGKNLTLLVVVAAIAAQGQLLELDDVLVLWATLAVASGAIGALMLWSLMRGGATDEASASIGFRDQLRQSWTHFLAGFVALASLQIDRLLAATLLPLEQSGIYFRHVFLAAAAYQAAGVLSHNRIIPRLYRSVQSGALDGALRLMRRERTIFLALSLAAVLLILVLDQLRARGVVWLQFLDAGLMVPMMLAYMCRGSADYNSLFLNARYKERCVLHAQAFAALCAVALGAALTPSWAAKGLVAGALLGSATYLFVTWRCVRHSLAAAGPET